MLEYTVPALASVALVAAVELLWLRTGLFRTLRYWLAMAIVLGFQVPVDGWLTKLSDPIVLYEPTEMTGLRFPWDIPVEDFAFGFGMVTLTMMLWLRLGRHDRSAVAPADPRRDRQETA
jgi:lycopene cyclase domain-containing protein